MGTKPWYQSKTVWATLLTTLCGIYEIVSTYLFPGLGKSLPAVPDMVYVLLGALGLYGRIAVTKTIR